MSIRQIGMAVGAAVVIAGVSVGGYMLLGKGAASTGESDQTATATASSATKESAPLASLAGAIPEKIDVYLEIPSVRGLAQATAKMKFVDVGLMDLLKTLDEVGNGFGKAFELSARDGGALVSSFKSVAIAARFAVESGAPNMGAVVSSTKPKLVKKLLATKRFTKLGKIAAFDKYTLAPRASGDASDDMFAKLASSLSTPAGTSIIWVADKGLLAMGTDAFLAGVVDVAAGKAKALASSAVYQQDIKGLGQKPRVFAYAPASALGVLATTPAAKQGIDDFMKDPGPFLLGMYMSAPGMLVTFEGGLGGTKVPVLKFPAPHRLDIANKLPADTLGYAAYSTKIELKGTEAEKKIIDIFKSFDVAGAAGLEVQFARSRKRLGVGLAELIDAIGDQGVVGVVTADQDLGLEDFTKLDMAKNVAVFGLQALDDQAGMKKLVDALEKVAPIRQTHTLRATPDGGFDASPKGSDPFISLRYPKGDLFIGVGPQALLERVYQDIEAGTSTLASVKAHQLGVSGIVGKPHMISWFDVSRVMRKSSADPRLATFGPLFSKLVLAGDNRITMTNALGLEPSGQGYRFRLDMLNSVGVLPALGIYGLRRYLASSKTAEAKQVLSGISRGAAAAFERENASGTRALCKSAVAVPSVVPKGTKYAPNPTAGNDFETGDSETGWKCLKFLMTQPHYFQYGYTMGGPYKGPAVGGPDPGKNGYEAWAIGDLDGDGVTSLFTMTGTITATGTLKNSPQIFITNELE